LVFKNHENTKIVLEKGSTSLYKIILVILVFYFFQNYFTLFKISSKIYNVISNGLINNTNNNAQSSKINNNNNKLTVQIPSANVTSNSNEVIVAQPQLSAIKRALKTFNNENS
jgi:hypothetical protein